MAFLTINMQTQHGDIQFRFIYALHVNIISDFKFTPTHIKEIKEKKSKDFSITKHKDL